jgi:quercetin dioxygenase-like cupin family protein
MAGSETKPGAREGQAGRLGVAERFVVPLKPGNSSGGKGPQFRTDAIRRETLENGKPINPDKWSETAEGVARESASSCPRATFGWRPKISEVQADGPCVLVHDFCAFLVLFCGPGQQHLSGQGRTPIMKVPSVVGAAYAAIAIATAMPAAAHGVGETVTPHFEHAITNVPGKSLVAVVVDYAPGGASQSHIHAKSAFIFGFVLSGEIESQVNDGPRRVYRVGENFYETPGSRHLVSRNASKTKPAKLLAVFVVDTDDKELTTPVK